MDLLRPYSIVKAADDTDAVASGINAAKMWRPHLRGDDLLPTMPGLARIAGFCKPNNGIFSTWPLRHKPNANASSLGGARP